MAYSLRIEDRDRTGLITTRTQNSRLWFVNCPALEQEILASLAKYQDTYGAILYAFVLMGNHFHAVARFIRANRAGFMRDLNAQIARLAKRFIPEIGRGKFWEKRYSEQELPRNEDIERYFFYCALQPVSTELAAHPDDYAQYNSFEDAINGIDQVFIFTDWTKYNNARRFNPNVDIAKYQRSVTLRYSRLPGYEHLSQEEYRTVMLEKREAFRSSLVAEHRRAGRSYPPKEVLRALKPGELPVFTKTSTKECIRPFISM